MEPKLNSLTRRNFLSRSTGLGMAALATLLTEQGYGADCPRPAGSPGILRNLHHAPKAKRVIYLFMSGGPSHIDLFDYKPALRRLHGTELPASVRMGQRVTGMTAGQSTFPCVAPMNGFVRQGQCGMWLSELLPHIGSFADDLCLIKSMHTEAINHDPAVTFIQTGHQQPGRPSLGAWLSYGLGAESQNLPAFVVMVSQGSGNRTDQPLFSRLWGAGFIPSEHQGVRFRAGRDPVLYLSNPDGIDATARREMLDGTRALNELAAQNAGDPEIQTRIAQYEMAFRMQSSVPELTDLSREPRRILDMYGVDRGYDDGGFARNCLLARRMVERGVRFVQLFHRGWDQHSDLPRQIRGQCRDVDQPAAALLGDLKARGLLEDTLVIFGGEFGRTVYSQGQLTANNHGRDHHGRCFSLIMAGAGVRPGITYGATDDFCYNITEDPVHIHDLNATLLHCLGIDHRRLTFRFQGRDYRLTDVHGNLVQGILS
ncbi:MAG: DUF1501 domain-containing protein [Gemmataceae bacterium]|nr:DUF1501 domain-containing protein [Gemmataceae bacterium]